MYLCVYVCILRIYLFTDNMLHYKVILHVLVFLILYYVLLHNKTVLKMSLLIPQNCEFRSGRLLQFLKSVDLMNLENAFKYLATSSPLVGGQSPPLALTCFIRELLCRSRILHSYIICSDVCVSPSQGHFGLSAILNLCK